MDVSNAGAAGLNMETVKMLNAVKKETDAPTSEEIFTKIEAAEDSMSALDQQCADAKAARRKLLVRGTDAELDAADENIRRLERQAERQRATVADLHVRLAESTRREDAERLDAVFRDATAAHDRGVQIIKRYAVMARELVPLLRELRTLKHSITQLNSELDEAGDKRRAPDPETTARPTPQGLGAKDHEPLTASVVLPDVARGPRLWPRD